MDQLPTVLASTAIFNGKIFSVRTDLIADRDGRSQSLDIVAHAGSICILASPEPDKLVLVRQYRHPARAMLWEIPAGLIEPGEDPAVGARRELREETGYVAGSVREIVAAYATPGFCDELLHLFLAEDLVAGPEQPDADERIEVRLVDIDAAWEMFAHGELRDVKTLLALMWLRNRRNSTFSDSGR